MKIERLVEAKKKTLGTEVEKTAGQLNAEVLEGEELDEIYKELDYTLEINKDELDMGTNEFDNLLITGDAGYGKTGRVHAWAKKRGINLFEIKASVLDLVDFSGLQMPNPDPKLRTAISLATTCFDSLERPNSVLFLDEYNRAMRGVRGALLELVNEHTIPDPREESGKRFLKNMLFTVAAINPADDRYNTDEMDKAEETRFHTQEISRSKKVSLDYNVELFLKAADRFEKANNKNKKYAALGKIRLVKAILNSNSFHFSSPEEERNSPNKKATNYRSFTRVINSTDGTKESLLARWNMYCDSAQKPTIEKILNNNKEVWDKATMALQQSGAPIPETPPETKPEGENPFSTKQSNSTLSAEEKQAKLQGYLQD